jgi:hypothetical protein
MTEELSNTLSYYCIGASWLVHVRLSLRDRVRLDHLTAPYSTVPYTVVDLNRMIKLLGKKGLLHSS